MAKAQDPQMLTANRLRDGDVLYWKNGEWVTQFPEGDVFVDVERAKEALAKAQAFVTKNIVVNPYLFDVRADKGAIRPLKEREIIRAAGPSVRDDLGKQATTPTMLHPLGDEKRIVPQTPHVKDDDVSI